MNIGKLMTAGILAFALLMFVISFGPEVEAAVASYTGSNAFVTAFLSIMVWAIPVALLIGVLVKVFKTATGGSRD